MNSQVLDAYRKDGKRLRPLRTKLLKAIHAKLPKHQRAALVVPWQVEGHLLRLRLIINWNAHTKSLCYFLTTLPSKCYTIEVICQAYKWMMTKFAAVIVIKGGGYRQPAQPL